MEQKDLMFVNPPMPKIEKQVIISVGREFGSGGHEIATRIAKTFNLPLYDHNILREVSEEKGVDVKEFAPYDEIPHKGMFYRTVKGYSNSPEKNIAYMQFEFLKKKADSGESFVVVGRCAEEVLKGHPGLITIFILADMDKKVERIMRRYNLDDPRKTYEAILKQDKKRKEYHNYFCEGKWGDSRNYEFSINCSKLGIDETTEALTRYLKVRIANLQK